LEIHLSLLRRQGFISEWHDRKIVAGMEREREIDEHLERASIILLLISPSFLASDYCYGVEMQRALERHAQGLAWVVPLLLRAVDWQGAPFAHLQVLPRDAKPVTSWTNQDEAFADIAAGIRRIIEDLTEMPEVPPRVPLRSEPTRTPHSKVSSIEQQNRERLIRRVRNFWIKGVFEKSLHNAALMTLGLQESPEAVENPWRLALQESEHISTPLPAGTRITEVYDDAGGELLILGEPGAGKTTLLLELARDLLNRAEQDQTHPIPVVFNLSSWTRKRQPLTTWLIEEMETKYQVPRRVGTDWINADQILPLLDGLDEVDVTYHTSCMQAINEYHQTHNLVSLVVCCRVNEYMSQTSRLVFSHAITIQPLTTKQVNDYLTQIGEQVASLRIAFQSDPVLQELSTTPLMLSILILAYQGSSLEEIEGSISAEERQQQIFATYTQRMLRRRSVQSRYSLQQTIHWLSYLALQMKQQSQTIFYLERIQPAWLMKKWQRQLYYGLIAGPICGLLIGIPVLAIPLLLPLIVLTTTLIVGLLFGWASEPGREKKAAKTIARTWMRIRQGFATALESRMTVGIITGLIVGISFALYVYLVDYSNDPLGSRIARAFRSGLLGGSYIGISLGLTIKLERRIEPMEALSWSWTRIRGNILKWLLMSIGIGLIVGLIDPQYFVISSQARWLANFLLGGLSATFYFILIITLVSGVTRGLSKRVLDLQHIDAVNQGMWRSARYGVIMAILIGVITTVFTGAIYFIAYFWIPLQMGISWNLTFTEKSTVNIVSHLLGLHLTTLQEFRTLAALLTGLRNGAILSLVAGLYYGGAAYMQHFILRFMLWLARYIPFNYPRFLDYAAERILLRKVGGGYIFVHRLLLEYFADLGEEKG
jgi:DNA polymerase III delta prime subunit